MMKKTATTSINTPIATINLNEKSQKVLNVLLDYFLKDHFSITDDRDEKICIIQVNSSGSEAIFARYQAQHPQRPIIVISNDILSSVINSKRIIQVDCTVAPKMMSDALLDAERVLSFIVDDKSSNTPATDITSTFSSTKTVSRTINDKPNVKKMISMEDIRLSMFQSSANLDKENDTSRYSQPLQMTVAARNQALKLKPQTLILEDINVKSEVADTRETEQVDISELSIFEQVSMQEIAQIDEIKDLLSTPSSLQSQSATKKTQLQVEDSVAGSGFQKFTSTRKDIDLDDVNALSKLSYSPEEYLQGRLHTLFSGNKNDILNTAHGKIKYFAKNDKVVVGLDELTLRSFASLPSKRKSDYPKNFASASHNGVLTDSNKEVKEHASSLLWKTAIWASGGRLPTATNIDRPFRLKHWPNGTRLMAVPHSMEVIALWVKEPISLRETINVLNIPQRYVFSVYSAVLAINLVMYDESELFAQLAKENSKIVPEIDNTVKQPKGFIGRLLKYGNKEKPQERV